MLVDFLNTKMDTVLPTAARSRRIGSCKQEIRLLAQPDAAAAGGSYIEVGFRGTTPFSTPYEPNGQKLTEGSPGVLCSGLSTGFGPRHDSPGHRHR